MLRLILLPWILALTFFVACGGGDSEDVTNREITDDDLSAMALPLAEMGPQYQDFEMSEDVGFRSNDHVVENADDPEDEADDVEKFGRINGFEAPYLSADAFINSEGVFMVTSDVELFEDAAGASDWLKDSLADMRDGVGTTSEGAYFERMEDFDPGDVGEEALAATVVISGSFGEGSTTRTMRGSLVLFRKGRLFCGTSVVRMDEVETSEDTIALARKLEDRVDAVLSGELEPSPTSAPDAEALPLDDYLLLTLPLEAELSRITAELYVQFPKPDTGFDAFAHAATGIPERFLPIYQRAMASLSSIMPPPEAAEYHVGLLETLGQFHGRFDDPSDSLDTEEWTNIAFDFVQGFNPLGELSKEHHRLVVIALEAREDDSLSRYLAQAGQIRINLADSLAAFTLHLDELPESTYGQADNPELLALYDAFIGELEEFGDDWRQLSPPAEAQALHDRQSDLVARTVLSERDAVSALRKGDFESAVAVALPAQETIAEMMALMSDWDELTITALSR